MRTDFQKLLIAFVILLGCLEMTVCFAEGKHETTLAAKQKQRATHLAVNALESHLGQFRFQIEYHGPDEKKHDSLWLSVAEPPEKLPSHYLSVRISEAEAKTIIKHLAESEFLWRGSINRKKQLAAPKSPYYTLTVAVEKGDAYFEHVAIGPGLVKQLKALGAVLDGQAAKKLKKLIGSIETQTKDKPAKK